MSTPPFPALTGGCGLRPLWLWQISFVQRGGFLQEGVVLMEGLCADRFLPTQGIVPAATKLNRKLVLGFGS